MALIACPECGHSMSSQAQACPACGYAHAAIEVAKANERAIFLLMVFAVLVPLGLFYMLNTFLSGLPQTPSTPF